MIAAPGAGKGTQGALIATHFTIPHIATGDLLRQHVAHQTDLGWAVQDLLTRGELVPDKIVLGMVREALIAAKRLEPTMSWMGSRAPWSRLVPPTESLWSWR
jgi:adenylate kinase